MNNLQINWACLRHLFYRPNWASHLCKGNALILIPTSRLCSILRTNNLNSSLNRIPIFLRQYTSSIATSKHRIVHMRSILRTCTGNSSDTRFLIMLILSWPSLAKQLMSLKHIPMRLAFINRLIHVVIDQVIEDLIGREFQMLEWPVWTSNDLLTFLEQSSSHIKQLITFHDMLSVTYFSIRMVDQGVGALTLRNI
jgi:hypothetical protein